MFKGFIFTDLYNHSIVKRAKKLSEEGLIQQSGDYSYLDIDDRYIHELFPMLAKYGPIAKPDYFNMPGGIGAHISIIYPEERVRILPSDILQKHRFSIVGLIKAQYENKEYYVLSVTSPSLSTFRQLHFLPPSPIWKGQVVMFHVTIGVIIS